MSDDTDLSFKSKPPVPQWSWLYLELPPIPTQFRLDGKNLLQRCKYIEVILVILIGRGKANHRGPSDSVPSVGNVHNCLWKKKRLLLKSSCQAPWLLKLVETSYLFLQSEIWEKAS